ncbi:MULTISPECIES: ArsR/SmtB family transcription factor [Sphingobium]|uniref:Helix-turn-helix transcriptional regulator n=2 Tax=Sphingobium fuliginis (strain ATCC 27551) TaxID=336203 RepID=A0A5B8CGK4_SPHSA|nr:MULTISPECIES: metalloregulator ArsR/SmtB family transcription factor [Sphingobium]OAP32820.1 transcriptional regulator [Sphingobium sp. 20006FA]AJR25719.1 ArsR family transcriptional regulator [Sphingobium sp. YBL2]KXU32437.1 transcriptional regulator [Sphingobium sp. AM]KYC32494.1 transcriptional regulator [Sphingobium sp. 22B]MCB4862046.1 metalloregulator ArsR/SmtB family transcription factor [Sphingobium sp. PNB]
MPSIDAAPARLFAALGDATRLGMIGRLADGGERSIGQLGHGLPISRQAVAKHLDVLLGAGLVTRTRAGREALFSLRPEGVAEARDWLAKVGSQWDGTLGRLKDFVESQP